MPVAPATPAPESTAEQVTEAPQGEKPESSEKLLPQSEVDKIVAKTRAQEQRRLQRQMREQIRAEVERDFALKQLQERDRPQQAQPGEPRQEDFKDYDSWIVAKARYEAKLELQQEREKQERETKAQREHREAAERAERMVEKIKAAADEFPDIEDVINGDVPFTQPMVAYFEEIDAPGKLIYHLGTNPAEALRIAKLPGTIQIRELVKLEAKLSEPPKATKTPPPITPSGTNASATKDPDDMDPDEWRRWRESELRKKHRRP